MKNFTGKRYFYWLGKLRARQGCSLQASWVNSQKWPEYAKDAYWDGWHDEYYRTIGK